MIVKLAFGTLIGEKIHTHTQQRKQQLLDCVTF